MKWKTLTLEEFAPHDMNTIKEVIDGKNISDERYTPTKEFLEVAYHSINNLLFENSLPTSPKFRFSLDESPKNQQPGKTNITVFDSGNIRIDEIVLNSSIMITLHEWIEVIVHEMIHVKECIEHPEQVCSENYDPHGEWFMKQASNFSKYGLRITKTFKGDFDTSIDSDSVKRAFDDEIILQIDCTKDGTPMIIKIMKNDKNKIMETLKEMGYDRIVVLHTDNINSTRLKLTDLSESDDLLVYNLTSNLKSKIGPLHEVETIELSELVNEEISMVDSSDEFVEITGEDDDGIHISIY